MSRENKAGRTKATKVRRGNVDDVDKLSKLEIDGTRTPDSQELLLLPLAAIKKSKKKSNDNVDVNVDVDDSAIDDGKEYIIKKAKKSKKAKIVDDVENGVDASIDIIDKKSKKSKKAKIVDDIEDEKSKKLKKSKKSEKTKKSENSEKLEEDDIEIIAETSIDNMDMKTKVTKKSKSHEIKVTKEVELSENIEVISEKNENLEKESTKSNKVRKHEIANLGGEGEITKKLKHNKTIAIPVVEPIVVQDQNIDDYRESTTKKIEQEIPENLRLTSLNLSDSTISSLKARKVTQLFPIQAASFAYIMSGKDLLARARTGTGKTLAFSLPIVESLKQQRYKDMNLFNVRGRPPRCLIMTPTRELAIQVHKELNQICSGELSTTCVYGGTTYDDQYIGFADDMDKILGLVETHKKQSTKLITHQVLLFSATMPEWIKQAVSKYMRVDKVTLDLIGSNKQKTSALVKHYCLPSRYQNRADILGDVVAVYGRGNSGRTIIFVETKADASELAMNEKLVSLGAQTLHGDIAQKQRETTMQGFRDGKFTVLITTNVCARGVDIPEVDLVINCEPPSDVESYIHRSGRTGRAGKSGICITFYKQAQEFLIETITKKAGVDFQKIGAPQPVDIISSRASQNIDVLKTVDTKVLSYFTESAQTLLDYFQNDSLKALECAMALICDTIKPLPSRSLLTANEGYITLHFQTQQQIRNVGYVKSIIQQSYSGLRYEDTIGWRMTADSKGVVVDFVEGKVNVSGDIITLCEKDWVDCRGVSCVVPKELPELQASYGSSDLSRSNIRGGYRGRGTTRGFSRGGTRGGIRGGRGRGY